MYSLRRLLPIRISCTNVSLTFLIFAALITLNGCSKKAPTANATPQPDVQNQTQGVPAPSQPVAPQPGQQKSPLVQADGQPDLPELNRTLIRWVMGHRRTPATFEEFAATAGVTIPPPPPGKKYMINKKDMHIVLVDR